MTYLEAESCLSETQVLSGHEPVKEDVDSFAHTEGHGHNSVRSGLSVQHADEVTVAFCDYVCSKTSTPYLR